MPQQPSVCLAQQLDADAALVRTFRLRKSSSTQQNHAVQRLHQWSRKRNIPCAFLFEDVSPTNQGRMTFSINAERLFIRYITDIVRHGDNKCGPESAMQYVQKIRGCVNSLHGFTMQQYHRHQTLDNTVMGLGITDPQKRLHGAVPPPSRSYVCICCMSYVQTFVCLMCRFLYLLCANFCMSYV